MIVMLQATVNFAQPAGRVKPMHAVNNGPIYPWHSDQCITNFDAYRAAGIPFARTHDSSFCASYGGEHTVDVHAIFPDFDRDPADPNAYDFTVTDMYLQTIALAGTEPFYRLGSKIEHGPKKYGTLPPRDFYKWAQVCEHIIRHYTEGWANGPKMKITYWEIWNEPDLDADDSPNKRCWGGTEKQFYELYDVTARHLKACFPQLKIGGPALAYHTDWMERFLAQLTAPLDFFSWHIYATDPERVAARAREVRACLDRHGFTQTESILNEWNYVRSFEGEAWYYSLKQEKSLKGAAYIAAVMAKCQVAPVDLLMYYDARPCGMNGMFNTDFVCECLKGYYPFPMFNELYTLGDSCAVKSDSSHAYLCAARRGDQAAVMLSCFREDDDAADDTIVLNLRGFADGDVRAECLLLDETHDMVPVRAEWVSGANGALTLPAPRNAVWLIRLKK